MVEHQPSKEAQEPNEPRAELNPDSSGARADSNTPSVTTSEHPAKNDQPAPNIERFFCIYCGYDLTGHSGDERRCPECGNVTTTALLRVTLLMQSQSKGVLEPAAEPSWGFWAVVFFAAASIGTGRVSAYVMCAVCLIAWVLSIVRYLKRYGHHYDCWWFLIESHIVRLVLPVAALVLAGSSAGMVVAPRKALMATVALFAAIALVIAWMGYRDLKRRLPAYKLLQPPETIASK